MKIDGINLNEDKILEIKAEQQKEYKYYWEPIKGSWSYDVLF